MLRLDLNRKQFGDVQVYTVSYSEDRKKPGKKDGNSMAAAPGIVGAVEKAPAAKSWAPTAKVSAGVLAAAGSTLLMSFFKNHSGVDISAADGAALTTVFTFITQYLVPERT